MKMKRRDTTYQSLQVADEETLEDLARLVTVADILKGLGGVLATDVEEDFLTAAVVGALVNLRFFVV